MLRSFQYAAEMALQDQKVRPESKPILEAWASYWTAWVGTAYVRGYVDGGGHIPDRVLLDAFLLEKATYEIAYELNNRPDWVQIPLRGVIALLA
jgi:maltose alpha-D-glucosyltransferase/alpha-amylase